jgi:predicted DNA binding protein
MITKDGALEDLNKIEAEAKTEEARVIVKVFKVIVKMLSTMRSNQLLTEKEKEVIQARKAEQRKTEEK